MKKKLVVLGVSVFLFSILLWNFLGGGGAVYIFAVTEKTENYTQLLENTQEENNWMVFHSNLYDYDENFLGWAENLDNLTENEFWTVMDALDNHRTILENLKEKTNWYVFSPPSEYDSINSSWQVGDNSVYYDDGVYGTAKKNQIGWWGGFNLPLPSDASSIGISVTLKDTYSTNAGGKWSVKLSWDNKNSWTDPQTATVSETATPGGTYTLDGTWGRTWSASEVRDSLWTEIKNQSGGASNDMYLDYFYATSYFTASASDFVDTVIDHLNDAVITLTYKFPQYVFSWSSLETWTASITAPIPPPTIIIPEGTEGEEGIQYSYGNDVFLQWSSVPGAEIYEIQISESPEFHTQSYTTSDNYLVVYLGRGEWYWRVRACVDGVWSEWSEPATVRVYSERLKEAPPSPPSPVPIFALVIALFLLSVFLLKFVKTSHR